MKFIKPQVFLPSFTCPHCWVIANQDWSMQKWYDINVISEPNTHVEAVISVGNCENCDNCTLWVDGKLYFPNFLIISDAILKTSRARYLSKN